MGSSIARKLRDARGPWLASRLSNLWRGRSAQTRNPHGWLCALLLLLSLAGSIRSYASTAGGPTLKRVLILYSYDREEGIYSGFDQGFRATLRSQLSGQVEFYTEYLDLVRFPEQSHESDLVKVLGIKMSEKHPDLIITVSYPALNFMLTTGKGLFRGTPVVAAFNSAKMDEVKAVMETGPSARSVAALGILDEPSPTLDLALRLQPDTQRVVVVTGTSQLEKAWLKRLQSEFARYQGRVNFTYISDAAMSDILHQLSALPPHTVVFNSYFLRDATGQFFLLDQANSMIIGAANVPVYGMYSSDMGQGIVGGYIADPDQLGAATADLAVQVLRGEKTGSPPVVTKDIGRYTVDWRQMRRWGISENRLPPGSVVLFRQPTLWEHYKWYLIAAGSLCVLETLLILGLLVHRRKRRLAENALRKEKTFSDAVIESLPGTFYVYDRQGKLLRWNKSGESVSGFSREEIAGASLLDFTPDGQKDAVSRAAREVFENGSSKIESDMLTRDGRRIPYYFTGVRVRLEDKDYLVGIGIDMTERKQAEEALRRSEEELRSFVERAPYGICRISVKEDRFLSTNLALARMLGYDSKAETMGLKLSEDLYRDTYAREEFRNQIRGTDYFNGVEGTWKRKDGKTIRVRVSGRRIAAPEGKGDVMEVIVEDVSQRHALEEQLRHAQKVDALGQLAGGVAHDFNNLLGVIIGCGELLTDEVAAMPGALKKAEAIKKAAERAASLTAQLLAFSRKQSIQPRVLNLNLLVAETDKMLRRLIGEDVQLTVALDPKLGHVKADPGQIVQVIMNLAVNARDAMPRGGKLTLGTANVNLEQPTACRGVTVRPGSYVMISVGDTGTGIDAQTMTQIFEPFFTTKAIGKGTGLGLATVQGIIERAGGHIFVDSVLEEGTTFRIWLPRINEAMETITPRTLPRDIPKASETLLLVEDEGPLRTLVYESLVGEGYHVLEAGDGAEALRVSEQHKERIHVLLTDVIMPMMSGPELAHSLKALRPDIKVLYMSGYTADKLSNAGSLDAHIALIQKPFQLSELGKKLRELLRPQTETEGLSATKQRPAPGKRLHSRKTGSS